MRGYPRLPTVKIDMETITYGDLCEALFSMPEEENAYSPVINFLNIKE